MKSLKTFNPEKIVVRMPNWIGDLIMATPILTDLRNFYPKAHITAMCRTPISELLAGDPRINELLCFNKCRALTKLKSTRGVIEKLKVGKYDLGVLMTHSISSAWWLRQGKVAHRLGYECNARGFLLTHPIPLSKTVQSQHLVLTYKNLLTPLGISPSNSPPMLFLNDEEVKEARAKLHSYGISKKSLVVGINPGATYGSAKCWLPERFKEVTKRLLSDEELFVVYFGDKATASLVDEICSGLNARAINLAGKTTLRELASLISLCDVLLTNDSGPMHIADALGTPVVALFGSTSEVVTGPYRAGTVIHKHVECSPCYQRTCPIDFRCMKRIEGDEVFQEISKILNARRSAESPLALLTER